MDNSSTYEDMKKKISENLPGFGDRVTTLLFNFIVEEIEMGEFDTIGGNKTRGLVSSGDYLRSIEMGNAQVSDTVYKNSVGSTDKRAVEIEYGSTPGTLSRESEVALRIWATKIGMSKERANWIVDQIREKGSIPKPVFRRAVQRFQSKFKGIDFTIRK